MITFSKDKINMKSRYIWILNVLVMLFITSARGQTTPGSNIVSRTYLSSDSTRMLVQRVYDNGLGDVIVGDGTK